MGRGGRGIVNVGRGSEATEGVGGGGRRNWQVRAKERF